MSSGRLVLVSPPQWTPQNPPFALVSLGGHLRHSGVPTRLLDLNLQFYLHVLSADYLLGFSRPLAMSRRQYLLGKSRMRLMAGNEGPDVERDAAHILRMDAFFEASPDPWMETARRLPEALAILRDGEEFYRPGRLLEALAVVDAALELAALPYFPSQLALNDYRNPEVPWTLEALTRATTDRRVNLFLPFMQASVAEVLRTRPRIVALSINAFSQVLAGLTLAALVRKAAPEVHVAIGGNFFGRVAGRLRQAPEFFERFCDSVLIGEGETTLVELYRCVSEGRSLRTVPEALFPEGGEIVHTPRTTIPRVPLQEVGFVDLADLPLGSYLTPEPVVCLQASRGCYWGACSFCDAYWGVELDRKTPDRVLAEMRHLRERYGVRHFEFIDECLVPADMAALAERLRGEGFHWFANARLEPGMADVVPLLPPAGASMLLWGFESGSARILKLLAKGVHPEGRWDLLRAAAESGLWNFCYLFFGFPGETRQDAEETIEAIAGNTDLIHSYGRSVFTLGKHSPLARNPAAFGVSDIAEEGDELSVNLSYRTREGMTPEEVSEVVKACTDRCRAAYGSPLWMILRNRENLHLYLARYGTAAVAGWRLPELSEAATAFQK